MKARGLAYFGDERDLGAVGNSGGDGGTGEQDLKRKGLSQRSGRGEQQQSCESRKLTPHQRCSSMGILGSTGVSLGGRGFPIVCGMAGTKNAAGCKPLVTSHKGSAAWMRDAASRLLAPKSCRPVGENPSVISVDCPFEGVSARSIRSLRLAM